MKALQWSVERGTLELMNLPTPRLPGPNEVIVKIAYAGCCGTDIHVIKKEFPTPNEVCLYLFIPLFHYGDRSGPNCVIMQFFANFGRIAQIGSLIKNL